MTAQHVGPRSTLGGIPAFKAPGRDHLSLALEGRGGGFLSTCKALQICFLLRAWVQKGVMQLAPKLKRKLGAEQTLIHAHLLGPNLDTKVGSEPTESDPAPLPTSPLIH